MTHYIEIENLKCGGCASSIKSALRKIDGVQGIEVQLENGSISVEGDVDRQILLEALNSIGYPEKGHNTIGRQVLSYVSCASGKLSNN